MAWSRQQNPTGVSNAAVRPAQADPLEMTTTKQDTRRLTRAKTGKTIKGGPVPISAAARKAEGFAPKATGPLG